MLGCGGHKIQSILCYVLGIHCLFIGCYTETESMGNEKFRQEECPFLLSEIAILHTLGSNGSSMQSCLRVGKRDLWRMSISAYH